MNGMLNLSNLFLRIQGPFIRLFNPNQNNQNIEKLCLKSYFLLAQEQRVLTVFFISHAFGKSFWPPARLLTDTQDWGDMTPW